MKVRLLHDKLKIPRKKVKLSEVSMQTSILKLSISLISIVMLFISHQLQANDAPLLKEDIKLTEALHRLSQKYEVFFSYDETSISSVEVTYQPEKYKNVEHALDELLKGTVLKYKVFDNRYIILYEESKEALTSLKGMVRHLESVIDSQEKAVSNRDQIKPVAMLHRSNKSQIEHLTFNVSGTVTDQGGETLIGVNIQVKGSSKGTATDFEGNFHLEDIDENSILVISYIGYQTQEVPVSGKSFLNIIMISDSQLLDEVVVVGYGTQKKSDVTGSVTSISSKGLEENPVTDISTALRGRAAGLRVSTGGNKPGDVGVIRIRGNRSFSASNSPLFVVDGIPVSGIGDFNIQDIESIEVLKDASATAIYGSRGANGVIIITTKLGNSGPTTISYNTYFSMSKPYDRVQMMNGPQFEEYKREAFRASGRYTEDFAIFTPVELSMIESNEWTDYQDLLLRTGIAHNHSLSINGGSKNTVFNVSLDYLDDKGIIPLQDYKRYNAKINFNHSFGRFQVGASMLGSYSIRNGEGRNPFGTALRLLPLSKPYDDEGNLLLQTTSEASTYNPLTMIDPEQNVNNRKRYRLFSSIFGEVDIMKGLKYRLNFGPDISHFRLGNYLGSFTPERREGSATAQFDEGFSLNYTLENLLIYNNNINDLHRIDVTGLYSIQTHQSENSGIDVLGVPINSVQFYNLGASENIENVESAFTKWSILSGMARVNYVFKDKYLATLTGRTDGSSRFGENNKWGFFPSAAIGWILSNEKIFEDKQFLDFLKLRISYGVTGNTGISPYQTFGRLTRTSYDFGGSPAFGYTPSSLRNDDLKWEKTASYNIGLDFTLFSYRLSGGVEFYAQNTSSLLLQRQLPPTSGFRSIIENIGKTKNVGVEGTLSTIIIPKTALRTFDWLVDLNFAVNNEEIVELYGGTNDDIGNRWFIGEPIHVFYDYQKIGIWQLGEESLAQEYGTRVGQIKVKDQNDDGVIDANDRVILGSNTPKLSGGLTSRMSFNEFSFTFMVYGSWGNIISSGFHTSYNTLFGRYNNLNVDYWTPDNPTNAYPQPFSDQERPLYHTTMAYFEGWFAKIGSVNIGYNLPQNLIQKIGFNSFHIYLNIQNPLTIAPYIYNGQGIDPEYPTTSTPNTTNFQIGANISF